MKENDGLVLIPSAVLVPDELRLDVGSVPTGMIPIDGKPMLDHIADKYSDFDVSYLVAVHQKKEMIRQYVSHSNYEWIVTDVGPTERLSETIMNALTAINIDRDPPENLYVNFADTLVSPIKQVSEVDYISHKPVKRTYRWTTIQINEGRIGTVSPKYEDSTNNSQQTFVGQFGFADVESFYQQLCSATRTDNKGIPPFYQGLIIYLDNRDYQLYEPESWLDVGHLDTFHRARKEFLNTRKFNELQVNEKNVITKRSEDPKTLINEIKWYQQIPPALQPYLPRLYDWSTDSADAYLSMEYIGYPSLADIQLYSSHGRHIWNKIFSTIIDMLNNFRNHTVDADPAQVQDALESIYLTKTRRRLKQLQGQEQFVNFFTNKYARVNGERVYSLKYILSELRELLSENNIIDGQGLSIIHGDFCAPNILYDPRNGIIKLIDPRGAFGEFTVYGDPRYDLAKLRHSFVGHYEHLINSRFSANMTSNSAEISYSIKTTTEQDHRAKRIDSILKERSEAPLSQVKLIESLLFLSMVPLHSDSFARQVCMLGQGLEKISHFLNG